MEKSPHSTRFVAGCSGPKCPGVSQMVPNGFSFKSNLRVTSDEPEKNQGSKKNASLKSADKKRYPP